MAKRNNTRSRPAKGLSSNMKSQPEDDSLDAETPSEEGLSAEEMNQLEKDVKLTARAFKEKKTNISALTALLSEYLDSYILTGYSAEMDEVVVYRITSKRDARAIQSLIDDIEIDFKDKVEYDLIDEDDDSDY